MHLLFSYLSDTISQLLFSIYYGLLFCFLDICALLRLMDISSTNACLQEDAKPIHAAKESRAIVERLLPITTPDPSIKDWTVDGVMAHAEQLAAEEEVRSYYGETSVLADFKALNCCSKVRSLIVHACTGSPRMFVATTLS
jgi:hypothetical protein